MRSFRKLSGGAREWSTILKLEPSSIPSLESPTATAYLPHETLIKGAHLKSGLKRALQGLQPNRAQHLKDQKKKRNGSFWKSR